jgi:hypothetical protein
MEVGLLRSLAVVWSGDLDLLAHLVQPRAHALADAVA